MSMLISSVRSLDDVKADLLIIPVTQYRKLQSELLRMIDKCTNGALTYLLSSGEFSGKGGELLPLYKPSLPVSALLLVGLGDAHDATLGEALRRGLGLASRHKSVQKAADRVLVLDASISPRAAQAAVEGYLLGGWRFVAYKSTTNGHSDATLRIAMLGKKRETLQSAVDRGVIIAEGQLLARELKETPPNDLNPVQYAERIKAISKMHKLQATILDESAIARERMGGLLAVGKGSSTPPRFAVVEYRGAGISTRPIVLVGKGITFDTGGISIKPAADMQEMKQDMAGSATVLAAVVTAARLKLKCNAVALMPIAENMPSGTAFRPGDILRMRSGKTVEITNTDAEGRLVLADALDYAAKFKPQAVIDIATLTGAARFILGLAGAPIMGNNKRLIAALEAAAEETGERVWELPIWSDYHEQMKSSVADLVNSGPPYAGTLAAAAFLEEFVGDWPWAHIDIAYVDLEKTDKPYTPKGATGFGVRLLVELLSSWKQKA